MYKRKEGKKGKDVGSGEVDYRKVETYGIGSIVL